MNAATRMQFWRKRPAKKDPVTRYRVEVFYGSWVTACTVETEEQAQYWKSRFEAIGGEARWTNTENLK